MSQFLPTLLVAAGSGFVLLFILWGTPRHGWMQSHWLTFVFLVPFLVLLWVHHALHLSDALMVATPPGEREAHVFNVVMAVVFFAGILSFVTHTFVLSIRSWRWLVAKLAVLAGYWGGILYFGS